MASKFSLDILTNKPTTTLRKMIEDRREWANKEIIEPLLDDDHWFGVKDYRRFSCGREQGTGWLLEDLTEAVFKRFLGAMVYRNPRLWGDINTPNNIPTTGFEIDLCLNHLFSHRRYVVECKDHNYDGEDSKIDCSHINRLIALSTVTHSNPVLVRTCGLTPRARLMCILGRVIDIHIDDLIELKTIDDLITLENRGNSTHSSRKILKPYSAARDWWDLPRKKQGPDYYSRYYDNL